MRCSAVRSNLCDTKRFPGRSTEAPAPDVTEKRLLACADPAARPLDRSRRWTRRRARPPQRWPRKDFTVAMTAMAKLRPHVHAVFDRLTVNVDEASCVPTGSNASTASAKPRHCGGFAKSRVNAGYVKGGAAQGGRWQSSRVPCGLRNGGHAEQVSGPGGFVPYYLGDKSSENFWSNSLKARDKCIVWSSGK